MGQGVRLIIPQTPIWVKSPTMVPQQYPASQNLCKLVGIANFSTQISTSLVSTTSSKN